MKERMSLADIRIMVRNIHIASGEVEQLFYLSQEDIEKYLLKYELSIHRMEYEPGYDAKEAALDIIKNIREELAGRVV